MSEQSAAAADDGHEVELRKEAWVMALYVAVCLLAALTAVAEAASDGHIRAVAIVWGTTIGLTIAHVFAFRVSARLVAQGEIRRHDAETVIAQMVGAVVVAVLATIPILLLPASAEFDAARGVLALLIAVVGYIVARETGASPTRSTVYGGVLLTTALAIAIAKNVLSGH